jgi:putative PEP-CTERM system histidine kinase
MGALNYIELFAALAGLAVLVLLSAFPRFGSTSWMLVLILVPAVFASAIQGLAPALQWTRQDVVLLSFACLILCAGSGCIGSYAFERADFRANLKKNRWFLTFVLVASPLLVAAVYLLAPIQAEPTADLIALGPAGYAGAVYLLLVSVLILANIEQTLRSAEEHVRWEIKFLVVGIASFFAATIYIASQILLYPPEYSYLPWQAVRILPAILLCACLLIFQSWRRSTGKRRVVVSQGVVYSTITLFSVGIYLVATTLVARWLSEWSDSGAPLEPIIFLVSAIILSAVLLATGFRHRLKKWIRRNFFAGNYDYRQLWMGATEKVQSIDSPVVTATALAELIHHALGSIDISVWLRTRDAQVLRLVAARGTIADVLAEQTLLVTNILSDLTEPLAVSELDKLPNSPWPADFFKRAKASLVVPLISSGRVVGLLTVGPDRSGGPLDREAREFLRVLAVHAASEFHKSELLESLVQTREAEAFRTFSTFLLHDLKNFTSTLSLIAKNAVRHHGNPDFQMDAFRSILNTAEKMKHLCNGLRTFSTTLASSKTLDDVNSIVVESVQSFNAGLSQRLTLDLAPVPKIEIDRQEFSRVLQNLILNADEACPDGPIEVRTRANLRGVEICVTDKGKGIPKEFLEKELFQPFHTTKGDGLGIGLFQSKKIIEAHDGTIEVESKESEGTVVRIFIPLPESGSTSIRELAPDSVPLDYTEQKPLWRAAAKN